MIYIDVRTEGTVVRLTPASQAGKNWMTEHLRAESWQRLEQGAVAVDPGLVGEIILGAQIDGLVVEEAATQKLTLVGFPAGKTPATMTDAELEAWAQGGIDLANRDDQSAPLDGEIHPTATVSPSPPPT